MDGSSVTGRDEGGGGVRVCANREKIDVDR